MQQTGKSTSVANRDARESTYTAGCHAERGTVTRIAKVAERTDCRSRAGTQGVRC